MPLAFLFQGAVSWRVLSIAAAALLIAVVYGEAKYIGHLKTRLESAQQQATENAAVAARAQQEYRRVDAIAARAASSAERRRARYEIERRKLSDVPPPQDGALAPVLRGVLNSLPERGAPSGEGHRASDTGDPHVLQKRLD